MAKIEGALKRINGVEKSKVLFNSSKAKVTFDENVVDSETIKKAIEKVGFEVLGEK
jgi:copper chaperone CopZ